MPTFNNCDQIYQYIKSQTKIALQTQVANRVKQIIQMFLNEQIYSRPQQEYQRFGNLLNGIEIGKVVEVGNTLSIEIYFTSQVFEEYSWYGDSKYQPNEKVSMNDLLYFLEEGYTLNRPHTTIIDSTIQEIKATNAILVELKSYFKSNGITVI